jgi:uncharacterized protein (DUF1778 family)
MHVGRLAARKEGTHMARTEQNAQDAHMARSMAKKPAAKSARLAARVSPEQKMILARAAALCRQPVSQFVVSSAIRAAEDTIKQHGIIALSASDSLAVIDALLNPEPPSPKLRRVAERHKTFMSQ